MFLRIFFNLSSKSPRNLAPATNEPKSKEITFFFFNDTGISLLIILNANPSTIAVLPTPGYPISTGLFFVLLDRT